MTPIKLNTQLQKKEVQKHLLSLDREDLRLRFGYTPTDSIIEKYVEDTWGKREDQWFGVYDTNAEGCIATLHVSIIGDEVAEFGCTVKYDYRKRGIGNELFRRGLTWSKKYNVKKIFMHCLSENHTVQHIAKKNKMNVVILSDGEAEATLNTYFDPTAPYVDVVLDRMAVYDMLLIEQQKFIKNLWG